MLITPQTITLPNNKSIIIRSAVKADAETACIHKYITAGETHFMSRYPEECIVKNSYMEDFSQENLCLHHKFCKYLDGHVYMDISNTEKRIIMTETDPQEFYVSAFINNDMIGNSSVTHVENNIKGSHRAYFGISIQQKYCNLGLGHTMLDIAINQAKSNGFEQLELGVYADNQRAIHLYEKHGFKAYGTHPRAFKLKDNTYIDEIIMMRIL